MLKISHSDGFSRGNRAEILPARASHSDQGMIRLEQVRSEMLDRFERIDRRFAQNEQRLARIDQRAAELTDRLETLLRALQLMAERGNGG